MIILKSLTALLTAIITLVSASGITDIFPHLAVIPDMVKVGVDYITLHKDKNAITQSELMAELEEAASPEHPFVLASKSDFDIIRNEVKNNSFNDYTKALYNSVIDNADALLDESIYPVLEYVLDEEDSILPISREVINRMIILGYAWQVTGDEKYAYTYIRVLNHVKIKKIPCRRYLFQHIILLRYQTVVSSWNVPSSKNAVILTSLR